MSPEQPPFSSLRHSPLSREALLNRAIQMVHAPARTRQNETARDSAREGLSRGPSTDLVCEPARSEQRAVGPTSTLQEFVACQRGRETITRKPLVVVIQYDPQKAKYAAKNVSTGVLILRHEDKARLRGMCDRMGLQVVDDID